MRIGGRYYWQDLESGEWTEVSEEDHDRRERFQRYMSKVISEKANYRPRPVFCSISDTDSDGYFKSIFTKSNAFNHVPFEPIKTGYWGIKKEE